MVIVDDSDSTRLVITPAKAVPEHEAWLYQNPEALKSVLLGLAQAQADQYAADVPDVDADCEDAEE
jgi:ABC-type nitrate/sulfonate/bicarbonate transport system substrate-binding protein